MQEQTLRDVLHDAASAASMPDRFLRPSQIVRAKPAQSRWQKPLVSVAAALAACIIIVMTVPATRVLAEGLVKGFVTMWTGRLGDTNATVVWTNPADAEDLKAAGQAQPIAAGHLYRSIDEAVAAAGFRPVETGYAGARLFGVNVQLQDSAGQRYLFASANYVVGTKSVAVVTEADLAGTNGNWRLLPYSELRTGDGQTEPMAEIQKLKLGNTEAVAYSQTTPQGTETVISWLQNGVMVHVRGSDADLVREVAAATVR